MNSILLAGLALATATDVNLAPAAPAPAATSVVEAAATPAIIATAPLPLPATAENPFTAVDDPRERSLENLSIFPTIARPVVATAKVDRTRRDTALPERAGVLDDFGGAPTSGDFIRNVAAIIGVLVTLWALIWSALAHRRSRQAPAPVQVRQVSLRDCDTFAVPYQPSMAPASDVDPLPGGRPQAPRTPRAARHAGTPRSAMATAQVAWTTYKFFILNAGGIIETARESAHAGDDAALNYARSFGEGVSVEVWLDRRKIATVG